MIWLICHYTRQIFAVIPVQKTFCDYKAILSSVCKVNGHLIRNCASFKGLDLNGQGKSVNATTHFAYEGVRWSVEDQRSPMMHQPNLLSISQPLVKSKAIQVKSPMATCEIEIRYSALPPYLINPLPDPTSDFDHSKRTGRYFCFSSWRIFGKTCWYLK